MLNISWLWWLVIAVLFAILIFRRRELWKFVSNDASDSMERLRLEIQQTGDDIVKRMEDQSAHLELLLAEADNKIAAMDTQINIINRLLIQSEINGNVIISSGKGGISRNDSGAMSSTGYSTMAIMNSYREQMEMQQLRNEQRIATAKLDSVDDGPGASEVFGYVTGSEQVENSTGNDEGGVRARNVRVADMLRQGYQVEEIARLLGMGRGEVVLIKNMNRL